jgi:hypothetical protein
MYRPFSALILLLVLSGARTAQAQTAASTPHGRDSARVMDSVRAVRKSASFPIGLSAWPTDFYCAGPMSATIQQMSPKEVLERIQLAARCGVRLVLVPPRRLLTEGEQQRGVFSVDAAKRLTDRYAEALPPDTISKYRSTILGLNLGDDYGCEDCWGGRAITQEQIAQWASYTRAKLPGIPLGVRVTPNWVEEYPPLAPLIDYTWAQYHTRKGDPKGYFDRAATIADRLGLRVMMGVNVKDCYGVGTNPCTVEDLVRFGRMALSHPESCAFINWRYDEKTWTRADIREAWQGLLDVAQARGRGAQECRRSASGA